MEKNHRRRLHSLARLAATAIIALAVSLPPGRPALSFDPDGPSDGDFRLERIDLGSNGLGTAMLGNLRGRGRNKLESALSQLVDEHAQSGRQRALEVAAQMSLKTKAGGVLVVVEGASGAGEGLKPLLSSRGGEITSSSADMIQVFLPLTALEEVAGLAGVERVRRPYYPTLDVISEGVGVINAPAWQTAGLRGSGVKIGIIDAGFLNYSALLGSELPPASRVTVQSFRWDNDIEANQSHGTAVAEIVYDVAPDATYYLANILTEVDFERAVDWMIANGVKIISMSLGWAGVNNYDGTGSIDNKVNAAKAAGIFWSNSAGNQAQRHWEGWFADTDGNGAHNFNGTTDEGMTIYATAGSLIYGALTWNDTWGNPSSNYDLYLVRSSDGQLVAASTEFQGLGIPPSEIVSWVANQSGYYYFLFVKVSDPDGPPYLEFYTYGQDLQYQVTSSSLSVPADASGAVAVGAFYYGTGTAESFSSQGPTNDGRIKPDLSAPDGVATSTSSPFFGTSAAAPHVAGAAALVKQAFPSYTPSQIQSFLEGRAIDVAPPGKDNVYGWGKLHLGSSPAPQLSLGATSFTFLADDETNPGPQSLTIANSGWGSMTWTAQEGYSWLNVSSISGTAPSTIQISVTKSSLISGTTQTGQIRIDGTSPSIQNSPQYVDVTFKYSATPLSKAYIPVAMKGYGGGW